MKDFYKWNETKIRIDSNSKYRRPKEREVWWCSIGINVGTEIYGKGEDFARPVLVVNARLGEGFIGIPLTSKIKRREFSCIIRVNKDRLSTALVSQIRNFDKRRLRKRIAKISLEDYEVVVRCLSRLYKIS